MKFIPYILVFAITVYAVFDCVRTPADETPGKIPKAIWLIGIIIFTPLGSIAWIVISRVTRAEAGEGSIKPTVWSSPNPNTLFKQNKDSSQNKKQTAPDDDPDFLFRLERDLQRAKERQRQQAEADELIQALDDSMPSLDDSEQPLDTSANQPGNTPSSDPDATPDNGANAQQTDDPEDFLADDPDNKDN